MDTLDKNKTKSNISACFVSAARSLNFSKQVMAKYKGIDSVLQFPTLLYCKNIMPEMTSKTLIKNNTKINNIFKSVKEFKHILYQYIYNIDGSMVYSRDLCNNTHLVYKNITEMNNKNEYYHTGSPNAKQYTYNHQQVIHKLSKRLESFGFTADDKTSNSREGRLEDTFVPKEIINTHKNNEIKVYELLNAGIKELKTVSSQAQSDSLSPQKIENINNNIPGIYEIQHEVGQFIEGKYRNEVNLVTHKQKQHDADSQIGMPESVGTSHSLNKENNFELQNFENNIQPVNRAKDIPGKDITRKLINSEEFHHEINNIINNNMKGLTDQFCDSVYKKIKLDRYRRGTN